MTNPSPVSASPLARAYEPLQLGPVTLRNRYVKAGTYEGMNVDNAPSAALVKHHVDRKSTRLNSSH